MHVQTDEAPCSPSRRLCLVIRRQVASEAQRFRHAAVGGCARPCVADHPWRRGAGPDGALRVGIRLRAPDPPFSQAPPLCHPQSCESMQKTWTARVALCVHASVPRRAWRVQQDGDGGGPGAHSAHAGTPPVSRPPHGAGLRRNCHQVSQRKILVCFVP